MALPPHIHDLHMLSLNPDYAPTNPDHPDVAAYLATQGGAGPVKPKRGEEIFAGTDYPREWSGFVGQTEAKEQLMVQVASAQARGARLEHTLLASGVHGIGKSTMATLLAAQAEVGFVQTSGPLDIDKARRLILAMEDRDILFIDEVHTMVAGGKAKAEWLLPFMTEGRLYTDSGAIECPDVTIVGATTDAGKLPATILSRFMVKPKLVPYTTEEAARIAENLALRMNVELHPEQAPLVARAASANPRDMRSILTAIRDLQFAFPDQPVDLDKAFSWAGFSRDGLTEISREMLLVLSQQPNRTLAIDTLSSLLGEPGPLKHHEQALLQRGFITITGRGRQLTDTGMARVHAMARGIL